MLLYAVIVYPVPSVTFSVRPRRPHLGFSDLKGDGENGPFPKKKQNKSYWTSFNPLPFILGCWPRKVRPVWVLPCFCPDVRLKISQTKLKIQGEAQNVTRKSYRKRCEKLTHFSGNVRHIRLKLDRMLHHYYRAYTWIGCQRPLGSSQVGRRTLQRFCLPLGLWESLVQILFQTNSP